MSLLEILKDKSSGNGSLARTLKIIDRGGPEAYEITLGFQRNLLEEKGKDPSLDDMLIFVEHEPVYTVGRTSPVQSIADPRYRDVKWIEIARGGQATFHGPGQLVAYPIFDLTAHGKDVHLYLRKLEEAIVLSLRDLGVYSFRRDGLTGVWVESAGEPRKVASIGIGVSRWVSYHGIALNISTDLASFRAISPCGQAGEVMTNLDLVWKELSLAPRSVPEVKEALVKGFREVFGFDGPEADQPVLPPQRKPSWLKVRAPGSPEYLETREIVKRLRLHTVCEEAKCPNMGECWSHHTATFMILGELCTRRCSFCSVKDGTVENLEPIDPLEPYRVGKAVKELGLKHVVITSVDRDDVEDMGADHFDQTVRAINAQAPDCRIELLIPDMRGKRPLLERILANGLVHVLNHNVETVPRLYRRVRPGAQFQRSLNVLRWAREIQPGIKTKSGVMVGLGETKEEVIEVMDRLREADVTILTIGQYLQPTKKQLPVHRFVTPEEFAEYYEEGMKRGFSFVESGPLVRSSYHAWKHSNDRGLEVPFEKEAGVVISDGHRL